MLVLRTLGDERRGLGHETWLPGTTITKSAFKGEARVGDAVRPNQRKTQHAPISLPPCAVQSARAHCSAKRRTRASSDRVCISTSRLSCLRSNDAFLSSAVVVSASQSATRAAETISLALPSLLLPPDGGDGNGGGASLLAPPCAMSATKTGMTFCRPSLRQNAVKMNVRSEWPLLCG